MVSLTSRALSYPGLARKIFTHRALAVTGTSRFAQIANLTVREAIGKITLNRAINKLPPLKPGYVRLTHKTNKKDVKKIVQNGLRYLGQISVSTFRFETAEDAAHYLRTCQRLDFADGTYYYPREMTVVLDLPINEYEHHNQFKNWGSHEDFTVPTKYIVGVIDTFQQSRNIRLTQPHSKIFG